jgi:UDP-N-acetylmuramoyl-tripeptide--D-alanyl-D-alanine ligase
MLSTVFSTARTKGNWNNDIGLPLSLLAMPSNTRVGVFEVGTNHPGEIGALCRILEPSWGVVTNIGPGHIGFFGSLEAIAAEKACLLSSLPAGGAAVLDRDGRFFETLRSSAPCRVVTVSQRSDADYVCLTRRSSSRQAVIKEASSGEEVALSCPQPGAFSVANVMLAAAVARGHGIGWDCIGEALTRHTPPAMRWQQQELGGVRIVNDAYNSNPLSARASIEAFCEEQTSGGGWLVLGGMLELGNAERTEHLELGRFVAERPWKAIVVVGELGALIGDGAESAGLDPERIFRCETNREAAHLLAARVAGGDAVLLKASRGMRLEEIIEVLNLIYSSTP